MQPEPSQIGRRLAGAPPTLFSAYAIAAAFSAYFCMYAFRKPFTAGTFQGESLGEVDYKTVLVISQVLGYTISKFIGIKVISEMPAERRSSMILILIGAAHASLLLFAIVPPPWNFPLLFLNGLPLGMVFGLVLAHLEGRQLTEALAAGLCASFIVSSGVVKSVGRWLVTEHSVSEYWMPFLTGAIFIPPLLLAVWMLRQMPPPSETDIALRSDRAPMTRADRVHFFSRHAAGLCLLFTVYVLITVIRSIRDDFAVEIWAGMGESGKPFIFAQTELIVMIGVVIATGSAIAIRNNRRAFLVAIGAVLGGLGLVAASTLLFKNGSLQPLSFMVLTGLGLYVPYVAFHTTLFERLIAVFREKSNIGFLMYLADATGYLGYVGVMLFRQFGNENRDHLSLFSSTAIALSLAALTLMLGALFYFRRQMPRESSDAARPGGARRRFNPTTRS